uniref:Iso_dh domain-containing protein n=1 Tax=Gongylonema pulchrum TaxID=637853 RepID=A0A183D8M7_9BILA
LKGIKTRHKKELDFIIVREQTEGEYSSLEHELVPGVVECLKISTEAKSRRIAKFAFDYAIKYGRRKVTAVHKANIMKLGDGLFLRVCEEVTSQSFLEKCISQTRNYCPTYIALTLMTLVMMTGGPARQLRSTLRFSR